ncbi:MAG: hypothetical protein CSA96_09605 [Bacteroidetes bacterium]|nr:MAG: hypothetical protein CSA96_09605 [Bacteroidota bacterium]
MKRLLSSTAILLFALLLLQGQDYYKLRKHTRISSTMNEAAAVPLGDEIVYITESSSVGISSPRDREGRRLFTIFRYKEGGGKRPFVDEIVSQAHEGPVSFSGDGQTMVFSQQRPSAGNRGIDPLGLYFAERSGEHWTNIRAYEHNDDRAWYFSPALSADGQTLFFAANLPDTIGGFDIYVSRFEKGHWTKPENLGPAVNTKGQELYPCVHSSGRLYFSTNGRGNRRDGFDLYETAEVEGVWSRPSRLAAPFNSRRNDYHVYFMPDFKSGYLTSDRAGGSKDIFSFGTDIPSFDSPKPIKKTYYKYRISDRKLDTVNTELFRYSWVINDTLEVPGHEIVYRFPKPGTYHLKLNVFDIQLDTLLEPLTFKTLTIRLNEQAVITCPDTVRVGQEVAFSARETHLPGFNIGRYLWEFGDGYFGEGMDVSHRFLYPGSFRVILGVQERQVNRRQELQTRENFREIVVLPSSE